MRTVVESLFRTVNRESRDPFPAARLFCIHLHDIFHRGVRNRTVLPLLLSEKTNRLGRSKHTYDTRFSAIFTIPGKKTLQHRASIPRIYVL